MLGKGGYHGSARMTLYNQDAITNSHSPVVVDRFKRCLLSAVVALPQSTSTHFKPRSMQEYPPAPVMVGGVGSYMERQLSRSGEDGPSRDDLMAIYRCSLDTQMSIVGAMGNFFPPSEVAPVNSIKVLRTDRFQVLLELQNRRAFGGRTLGLTAERIRLHEYLEGSEGNDVGHNDANSSIIRTVGVVPIVETGADAIAAYQKGYGEGRSLVLTGTYFDKPTGQSFDFVVLVDYIGSHGGPVTLVLSPEIGHHGQAQSSEGGFIYSCTHKGSNAGYGSSNVTSLLINLAVVPGLGGITLDEAFGNAQKRSLPVVWTAQPPAQRVVTRGIADLLVDLDVAERMLAVHLAHRYYEALLAQRQGAVAAPALVPAPFVNTKLAGLTGSRGEHVPVGQETKEISPTDEEVGQVRRPKKSQYVGPAPGDE